MQRIMLLAFLLAACGEDAVDPTTDPPPPGEPVYFGQVQKIINDNCVDCHSTDPDRLAPFSLATLDDVLAAATDQPLAFAVMNREMPPFYADQDNCNTFPNAHWLSPDDLDTLVAWLNGARAAGDVANSITTPPPAQPELAHVDRTLDIGIAYTPDPLATDDFRCFVVDAVPAGQFVTGVHVKPTNLTVAHHVILFTLDTPEAEADVLAKQQAAGGAYRCDGGPTQLPNSFLAGWVPGMQAELFPANTGIATSPRKMVVQMHYNLEHSDGGSDRTTIDLQLAPSVATPAQMIRINGTVDLPPHDPDAIASGSLTVPAGVSAKLWGTGVHMHTRGTGSKLTQNGRCLMDLVNWSFHWQHFYWYSQPIEIRGGDRLALECHYDTSNDSERVGFCEGTECEMCIQFGYATEN
jgi:hypothetical protein